MYFNKIVRVVIIATVILSAAVNVNSRENVKSNANASERVNVKDNNDENVVEKADANYWDPVMDAITHVESRGNSRAVSGKYCGAMQIGPGLVNDCNAILKSRGSSKRFTLNDRFSIKKSREMFLVYMSKYNPSNDIERGIRIWNGGAHYKVKSTNGYLRKVMTAMARQSK